MDENTFEEIIIIKWNQICRVCLNDSDSLQPLTDYNTQYEMPFYDMINVSTGLNMAPDDTFPQMLCPLCIQQLVNVVEFNIKCQSSENILSKLFVKKNQMDSTSQQIQTDTEDSASLNSSSGLNLFERESYEIIYEKNDSRNIEMSTLQTDTEDNTSLNSSFDLNIFEEKSYKSTEEKNDLAYIPNKTLKKTDEPELIDPKQEEVKNCKTQLDNVCSICNINCKTYRKLILHKKTKLHAFTCWECEIDLKNKETFNEHLKNHKAIECSICGKVFNEKSQCVSHMATHSKENNIYLCTFCGKKYATLSSLNVHLRIHTGERKYKCTYCEKTFIHWNLMKFHVRSSHTKERPYECHVCNKLFSVSSDLRKHSFVHSAERPFPCTLCDMAFKRKSYLRHHMYKHTGERKVVCEICDKRFTKTYNLKLHMVTHTGERKHVCTICKKGFTQAHVLRSHMKTHRDHANSSTQDEELL